MDTIFATATAPVKSGVAIIRVSGTGALNALEIITRQQKPKQRFVSLRKIYNPQTDNLIDEAIVFWFKAPHSFTGEDVVELHVHGGRAVISEVLACLGSIAGLRTAEPGEFSRRAFFNGKMDLTEAEGLADLINAETIMQARLAQLQKQGTLGRLYDSWREAILSGLANIEAYIDFPDEEIPENIIKEIETGIFSLSSSIEKHLDDNRKGERLREGLHVAIIGPPNAGKSTLLNKLANREVAIVSEHAGTTRDVIEVRLDLDGYPVIIADTAGIRDALDSIEAEGIKRALSWAETADLTIIVVDALLLDDAMLQGFLQIAGRDSVVVVNKVDLVKKHETQPSIVASKLINTSLKNAVGVDEILQTIKEFAQSNLGLCEGPLITRQRHRDLLQEALASLNKFSLAKEIELAAEDLRRAAVSIGKITGRINVDEVLDLVFSNFCIGK